MRSSLGTLTALAVLGLSVSCSQTSAEPEYKAPPRVAEAPKAPPKPPEKGPTMAPEAILTKHYADKGWGKPVELVAYPRVPHLYRVDFADKGDYAVVHHGKVVEAKGLAAMASYMKD